MCVATVRFKVPPGVVGLGVRVICGAPVSDREVLVSCVFSTPTEENLDLPKWPKYRLSGLPAKFMREHSAGEAQSFPNIELPTRNDGELRITLEAERVSDWSGWALALRSSTTLGNKDSEIWIFDLEANNG